MHVYKKLMCLVAGHCVIYNDNNKVGSEDKRSAKEKCYAVAKETDMIKSTVYIAISGARIYMVSEI